MLILLNVNLNLVHNVTDQSWRNCSLLQPSNSVEEKINMCEAKKKKTWQLLPCAFTPVVNSSAEKYCIHIEFWALRLENKVVCTACTSHR